jgi:hypothetical protein
MRQTLAKRYPSFDSPYFSAHVDDHWCTSEYITNVPNRFEKVLHRDAVGREQENFVMFDGDVSFSDDHHVTKQDAWFMYNEPIYLSHPRQLRGSVYDGDVDFFAAGPIEMENGSVLQDPNTQRGVRYPYKLATYYPIRNALIFRGLVFDTPTDSMVAFVKWVFDKVNTIGYKYNTKGEALLIGCDPEFTILDMLDERIRADTIFPTGSQHSIGCDGHAQTGELRPKPASCPLGLTSNVKELMNEVATKIGNDKKIATGGGGEVDPLGHHVHFNKMISSEELELLDLFVGRPSLNIKGAKRPSGNYERLGRDALRAQPHGCEYRTPPSVLIPEITDGLHTTAYCAVATWERLEEGDTFDIEVDDSTGIPTLDSYLSLDYTSDKRYEVHLEEWWKWCNRVGGREIDPKQDALYHWVEGRREVKPEPGLKINWSSNVFPGEEKEMFIPVTSFSKIHSVSVFILPTTGDEDSESILQVCIPDDVKARVNMTHLIALKQQYAISKILGFDHSSTRLGFTNALLNDLGGYTTLKQMVIDFAKVVCV